MSRIECQVCHAKTQLYLCPQCCIQLRDMLIGLTHGQQLPNGHQGAGWLEYLADAAYSATRLGESARRSTDHTTPLPVNLSASALLDRTHAMLASWFQQTLNRKANP